MAAEVHKFLPPYHRRIIGNFLDLPPLREHIPRPDGPTQGILYGGDDNVHDAGVLADMLKLVVKLVQGDGGDRLGLIEVELNFLFRRQGVDHVGNAAHQIHRVEHIDGLGAVGHGDGHLVPGPDAQHLQALGTALDLLDHLAVGGGLAHKVKGDVVGVFLGHLFQSLEHRPAEILQVHGHIAHVGGPGSFHFTHTELPPS